jgi:hypothetical protein
VVAAVVLVGGEAAVGPVQALEQRAGAGVCASAGLRAHARGREPVQRVRVVAGALAPEINEPLCLSCAVETISRGRLPCASRFVRRPRASKAEALLKSEVRMSKSEGNRKPESRKGGS